MHIWQDRLRIDSAGFFTTGSISYWFCGFFTTESISYWFCWFLYYRIHFVLILSDSLLQKPDTEGSRESQPEVPKIPLLKSRFFIMWEGPFSSPGGWEDFSEAEPSRAGSKVTNLHEASRKWGQISTTGAVVHKLTPTPASKIWRQFEHSSRGIGGVRGGRVIEVWRGEGGILIRSRDGGQVPTQITNCCIPARPPTPYAMRVKYNATMIATMFSDYSDCGCGVVDVDDDQ